MATNDLMLLDQRFNSRHKAQAPDLSDDQFFNVFACELLTQDYQLPGPEFLQYGIVDGAHDCGVDALFTFVNGTLVTDEFRRTSVARGPDLDLLIAQCKTSTSFGESPVEKLAVHLPQILHIDRDSASLRRVCNPALLRESQRFLDTYSALATARPKLRIQLAYVCRGGLPSDGVVAKAKYAEEALQTIFREASVEFAFYGARELVDLGRRPARIDRELRLAEVPLTSDSGDGYVCLVRLHDYFELIRDPSTGRLDAALFEANVREHEGESPVNTDIHETLNSTEAALDFWWLNNGVTIVADEIGVTGKRLALVSPQIVNGLQTSTEIFKHFDRHGTGAARHLLVRVIRAEDSRIRDRIVKATNSQNELPPSALRATEPFQRDIEEFLAPNGYFYDRKRNYSRTRGYDEKRVVSMSFAGHAVAATLLQSPHTCRRSGAALLNDDEVYGDVFNSSLSLHMYLKVIWLLRKVQAAIVDDARIRGTSVDDWQYHVAMVAAILLTRKERPADGDLAGMDVASLKPERILDLVELVAIEYSQAIPAGANWQFSDISTSATVVSEIRGRVNSLLKSVHWRGWPAHPVDRQYATKASEVFYKRVRGDN